MSSGAYIGIDLGTTYSAVASIDNVGRPKIIQNDGKSITASCVMLENDKLIVGEKPEARYGHAGFEVGARFKNSMGDDLQIDLAGRRLTPTDLSAAVLSEMKKVAEADLGEIAGAVITIPANFEQEARDATMLAAKKAGLNVKYIINEPTAAALYYGYKEGSALNGNYVIYDLGGGTFDVSVVNISGDNIEVLATEGVRKLGGDDFDKALRSVIQTKFANEHGISISDDDLPLSEMSNLKRQLSEKQSVKTLENGEIVEITRVDFEEAIGNLVEQTELLCESVMDEAGLSPGDIEAVFLAGGSTRIPVIRASITKIFKKEPLATANVDEVVALGAALYAAMKAPKDSLNSSQASAISRLKVDEIATYYFGTISIGFSAARETAELQNTVIIEKGARIPVSRSEEFFTVRDNQENVACQVTRSASPETDPRFVSVVWSGDLNLPPGRPEGQKIVVTYAFDENGMMQCSFVDAASGRETKIDLDKQNSDFTSSDIDKFLVE